MTAEDTDRRGKGALTYPAIRRRYLRIGIVFLALGTLCGVSLVIGWIVAGGDPNFHVSGRRDGHRLWVSSIWIGTFGVGMIAFGISQLRAAALFRKIGDGPGAAQR